MENKEFKFSIDYLKKIHKSLFSDILKKNYVGIFRNYNISKNERVLSGNSVIYADYRELSECLNYDFEKEKKNNYKNLSLDEKIKKYLILFYLFGKYTHSLKGIQERLPYF